MNDSYNKLGVEAHGTCAALVVAHPGHELLVHGWVHLARPVVFIITDGSGRTNQSRLESSTKFLNEAGAKPGSIYGRLTDLAGYTAILDHDFKLFTGLAEELAEAFIGERIDYVAGDAVEGYNPMHDVCRLVLNAAVRIANRAGGRRVGNFEFSLIDPNAKSPAAHHGEEIRLQLGDDEFARKVAAAREYTGLGGEVDMALSRVPVDAFRVERLYLVDTYADDSYCQGEPFYEQYGRKQVLSGHYHRMIRYDEHIEPLARALCRHTEEIT